MYDFEAATGITQENVEQIVRDRDRAKTIRRHCAWCKKDIDTGEQLTEQEYERLRAVATHGICENCSMDEMCEDPS